MNTKDLKISSREVAEIRIKNVFEGVSSRTLGSIYGLDDSYVRKILRQERRPDVEMKQVKGYSNYIVTSEGQIYSISAKKFIATDMDETVRLSSTKKGNRVRKNLTVKDIVRKHFS